jgi:hypothetical protein
LIYVPLGSGTVISPDGFILTNQHVVDVADNSNLVAGWEEEERNAGTEVTLDLHEDELLILGSPGILPPEPLYMARVVEQDVELDLAVLQITADASGSPVDITSAPLPFVPLGDSDSVTLGDPVDIFSYPGAGGDSLTYTTGVVSGFNREEGREGPAWITTDTTISGGSSGGTAVSRRGELIGVPTQGSSLDCRPGDTNLDGTVDAQDVGCIPVGGSIGQLRPMNLARDMLNRAGADVVLGSKDATQFEASAVGEVPAPADPELSGDSGLVESNMCERYQTQGHCPSERWVATYCASGPFYPIDGRLQVSQDTMVYGDVTLVPELGGYPFYGYEYLYDAVRLEPGSILQITAPHYEIGACDA